MTAAGRLVDVKSGKPVFQKNHNEFSGLGRVLKKAFSAFVGFYSEVNEQMQFDLGENGV